MASVARITDIRGLVSLNDGEEILKEKDPISENGGILTISDFARIIFDDGREIEVQGPAQITLNENFFQTGEFDIQDVQIGNLDLAQNVIQNLATNLEGAGLLDNQAEGFVRTEQLDPDNINFGNNDIDFVLEDEEQILNPVTDAPAARETPEETTETPEETTETPEETIPESTTDVISEQTIDEDTKDSVVEQTVDAVQEDTTDSIVNVPAQDEQTIDGIDEETTPESTNDVVTEQTTDAVAENTVPENIVTDFVPESTVAETPETTTDEQTADVVSENTIDTVVTVPEQAEQTVDAVQEDTTDSIVNVSAQDEQTIAEIAEETTPESTNDVVTEQTTDEQTTAFILPHNFKTIF